MKVKKKITDQKLISFILSSSNQQIIIDKRDLFNETPNVEFSIVSDSNINCSPLDHNTNSPLDNLQNNLKLLTKDYANNMMRYGTYFDETNNTSLYYTILFHIYPEFRNMSVIDQTNYIGKLRDKLIIYASDSKLYEKYRWTKRDMIDTFTQYKVNKIILKLIADYFSLNLFILNISLDYMNIVSSIDYFDIFRQNVIISFCDDSFEPILYNDNSLLDYNNDLIQHLLLNPTLMVFSNDKSIKFCIKLDNVNNSEKEVNKIIIDKVEIPPEKSSTVDSTNEYEVRRGFNQGIQSVTKDSAQKILSNSKSEVKEELNENNYTEIQSENKQIKMDIKINNKMKLEEIQSIAQKLNIDIKIVNRRKTKDQLMMEIKKALST